MPVPKGTTYAYKTLKSGKKIRLAFYKGKVIEAVSYDRAMAQLHEKRIVKRGRFGGLYYISKGKKVYVKSENKYPLHKIYEV